MSATIGINNSKFVIFGAGHDYTLADSGEGEKVFFSHPFVPLNSVNYAGQYYFLVPDENGEMFDAVKDDISHCTFTPALGTAFSTEGETTVKVEYYREYIYAEETLIVQKTLEQAIKVVNHGTIANTYPNLDVYSDGYGFIRPNSTGTVESKIYTLSSNQMTKCSSIPWRATGLGNGNSSFINSPNITDISELEYADVSKCTQFHKLFYNAQGLSDISALAKWDVSSVRSMHNLFQFTIVSSLESLAEWNTSSLTDLEFAFNEIYGNVTNLKGLENWDVSKVTTLRSAFGIGHPQSKSLRDISALAKWDVSNVTSLESAFAYNKNLQSLAGLESWDVSKVTNMFATFAHCEKVANLLPLSNWKPKPTTMYSTFEGCSSLKTLKGLEKIDTSNCTLMRETFRDINGLLNIEGIENWDVSKVTTFVNMFLNSITWVKDLSPIKDWDVSHCREFQGMLGSNASVRNLNGFNWDISSAQSNSTGIFLNGLYMCYAEDLNKDVYEMSDYYYDYEGNWYSKVTYGPYPRITKDASSAENWTVNGTGLGAFDSTWSNRPSWN